MDQKPIEKVLRTRVAALHERLRESDSVTRALRSGEVDAVVVLKKDGADVFPIHSDEPLYRAMVEELPHGVATLLPDSTIVYANRHLISRIEKNTREVLGRSLIESVEPSDQERFSTMLHRALSEPQELEVTFRFGHDECPMLVSANRLPVTGVEAIGLALIDLRDHHGRLAAEESSLAKDQLLASVSHELRTPLTSMMGWVQLLELEFAANGVISEGLHNLKNAVLAESAIVDDLLDISRVTRGSLPTLRMDFDVLDALRTAASFVTLQAGSKGIALNVTLPGHAVIIHGDPDRLRQVFVNLLSNAIKFTEPRGTVDVTVGSNATDATVSVRDTGRGIGADFLPYVFEAFRRGDGTSGFPGLGIGLAIARSLVDAHGGTIAAASDGIGTGATFTVRLPLVHC
jgi:signal transduction histidine kinase